MKLRLLALFCFVPFFVPAQQYLDMIEAGTYPITEIQQAAKAYFDVIGHERGSGYKQFKRWEYVALMEMDEKGVKIPNNELSQRARDYRRAEKEKQQAEKSSPPSDWKQLGPTYWNATSGWNPGVGRVTSIGIDPNNTSHLIIGSPTGGVWKSLDGGNNWSPLTDNFSTVDVYALEISPYNNQHYLWGSTSGRIYRSLDGGATWLTTSNVTGNGRVSRIQFHPTDPNVVYAVSESNGLFRSTNKGATWTAVTGVSGVVGYDMEFKPGDANTIYFSGTSVYRSTNGGATFSQIPGFGTANNNYKMMGVSSANPSIVYVLESNGGRFGAFYKSINSGAVFTKLVDGADINYFGYSSTGDDDKGQAPRDMDVAANPFNANEVHIAGTHTWKSINGGVDFSLTSYWVPGTAASLGVGYNHADIDILKFAGNTLYVGSDGGIYTSIDGAASFQNRSVGLGIKEFYKIGVSKTNPNVVSGGSQDNGTSVMRGANRQWVDWLGADGMETFVDWSNASILYGTSQNGSMYRSTNQGNSRSSIAKPDPDVDGAWITPFEQDPQVATTIYVAFADVWKSTNSGGSWTKISSFDNGNMSQMKLAPSDNKRIYVSRGASLFTTANGGTSWSTTAAPWGGNSISYISVHPLNPQRLLIVTSSAVYHSADAGATWTNIGTGLPSNTKYCATWENSGKNGIYVGGFGFVSYTNDDLPGQWIGFFNGLPNARVYELEINYISHTIFAGTYGRGLWESPLYQAQAPAVAFTANNRMGCREITVAFTDNSQNGPTAWEWTFQGGTPASSTEQNPVVTFSGSGAYSVQLKASNAVGQSVLTQADYISLAGSPIPLVADVSRCDPGEVSLEAIGLPAEQINWYAQETDVTPLFIGEEFITNLSQTTSFYVSASTTYQLSQQVGPSSNTIGGGGDHNGDYFQIMDVARPFLLQSATVYAVGAKNRTFQLRDANQNVLLEKTVYVEDGENRIVLDMDIPAGVDLQLGCISPANLYRNNSGVSYPYSIGGLINIKSSTAGPDYYYYLYDMAIESTELCESDRVLVTGTVKTAPMATTLAAAGPTTFCSGGMVEISAENICVDCTVQWSNGETSPTIVAAAAGLYTATIGNSCGDSPVSDTVSVVLETLPEAPMVLAGGATALCPGSALSLSVNNPCPGCSLLWSTGEASAEIMVSDAGLYDATFSNTCGEGPVAVPLEITQASLPPATTLSAAGSTLLCAGESVMLRADNICVGCTVQWSTGETGSAITVAAEGNYTATIGNACGLSEISDALAITFIPALEQPVVSASGSTTLCPGESVLLTVENVCPGCTVQWSTGENGPGISVSDAGAYLASFSNVCGNGPLSIPISIDQAALPTSAMITASGPTLLCSGASVALTVDPVCAGCIVHWSNGETGSSISVSTAGLYGAMISNGCGVIDTYNEIPVTVGSMPAAPTVSAAGATSLCAGQSVVLTADYSCPDCTVQWSTGETSASITVSSAGDYLATLHNDCGESPASNSIQVTTLAVPDAPTILASGPVVVCPGNLVFLMADNPCSGCTVLWSNGATGPGITVALAGAYTASFHNVCGDSPLSNTILVSNLPAFVPTVTLENLCHLSAPMGSNYQWFLNGTEIPGATDQSWEALIAGEYSVSMTGPDGCAGASQPVLSEACMSSVRDLEGLLSVIVYPNPANDRLFFNLQTRQASNIIIDLFAADGRFMGPLFKGDILPGGQILNLVLPELPTGMYQYRMTTAMGRLNGNFMVQQR